MKLYHCDNIDTNIICEELLNGYGAVCIKSLFSPDDIVDAREKILLHSNTDSEKVTHFQGKAENDNNLHLQRRVWNLLNKGDIFVKMATHPVFKQILSQFLGDEFIMGSIAANRILPNGPGQEPHIDYPYWDFYKKSSFPMAINASYPLNAQITILLDPFTEQSGATAYMPQSQKILKYPNDEKYFYQHCQRMKGNPGDAIIFFGAVWHCAMPNFSNHDRSAILLQYLPKFIVPMEDMKATLHKDIIKNADDYLKQLLGMHVPYPEILEDAEAKNTIGVN